jgi:hypothetical protein
MNKTFAGVRLTLDNVLDCLSDMDFQSVFHNSTFIKYIVLKRMV